MTFEYGIQMSHIDADCQVRSIFKGQLNDARSYRESRRHSSFDALESRVLCVRIQTTQIENLVVAAAEMSDGEFQEFVSIHDLRDL
jgi:hypothetical protein